MSSPAAERSQVLTVTDLTTALTCPRLFWFGKVEGKSTLLGTREGRGIGRRVHRLIDEFEAAAPATPDLQAALGSRPLSARPRRVRARLEDLLYRVALLPDLERQDRAGGVDGDDAVAVWEALGTYAGVLAELLSENARVLPAHQVLPRTLLATELHLWMELPQEAGCVELRGRADGLWFDHRRERAMLVEYKTRPASKGGEDFLQLSLYHWLLEEGNGVVAYARVLPLVGRLPRESQRGPTRLRGPEELRGARRGIGTSLVPDMVHWMGWTPGAPRHVPPGPEDLRTCELCPVRAECYLRLGRPRDRWVPGG